MQASWESTIASNAHNDEEVMKHPPGGAPEDVYARAVANAACETPNPVPETERLEILAEEERAWCMGFLIAQGLGVDAKVFVVEANAALAQYFPRLNLHVNWAPSNCHCSMDTADGQFVSDLTR